MPLITEIYYLSNFKETQVADAFNIGAYYGYLHASLMYRPRNGIFGSQVSLVVKSEEREKIQISGNSNVGDEIGPTLVDLNLSESGKMRNNQIKLYQEKQTSCRCSIL